MEAEPEPEPEPEQNPSPNANPYPNPNPNQEARHHGMGPRSLPCRDHLQSHLGAKGGGLRWCKKLNKRGV